MTSSTLSCHNMHQVFFLLIECGVAMTPIVIEQCGFSFTFLSVFLGFCLEVFDTDRAAKTDNLITHHTA